MIFGLTVIYHRAGITELVFTGLERELRISTQRRAMTQTGLRTLIRVGRNRHSSTATRYR